MENLTPVQSLLAFTDLFGQAETINEQVVASRGHGIDSAIQLFDGLGRLAVDTVADAIKAERPKMSDSDAMVRAYEAWLMTSARMEEVDKVDISTVLVIRKTIKVMSASDRVSDMDAILSGKGGLFVKLHQLAIKAGIRKERVKREVTIDSEAKVVNNHLSKENVLLLVAFNNGDLESVISAEANLLAHQRNLNQSLRLVEAAKALLLNDAATIPATPGVLTTAETISA